MVMKLISGPSLCLLLLLCCFSERSAGHMLHLGSCTVKVHTHELRQYYTEIRQSVIAEDSQMGVKLLTEGVMKNMQEGESCCFLRLLLGFYTERVFTSRASFQPQYRRSVSALANAFINIKNDLKLCHCHCGEDTRRRIDSLLSEFDKLDIKQAALKAVGELDSLLEWLNGFSHNAHTHHQNTRR